MKLDDESLLHITDATITTFEAIKHALVPKIISMVVDAEKPIFDITKIGDQNHNVKVITVSVQNTTASTEKRVHINV